MEQKNNNYELSFWFSSQLNEKEAEEAFNNLIKEIETLKGVMIFSQAPQLNPLAYQIKKDKKSYSNAYFGFIRFTLSKESLLILKEKFRFNKDIIRYLIIKGAEKKKSPLSSSIFNKRKKIAASSPEIKSQQKQEQKEFSIEELDKKLNEILKEKR